MLSLQGERAKLFYYIFCCMYLFQSCPLPLLYCTVLRFYDRRPSSFAFLVPSAKSILWWRFIIMSFGTLYIWLYSTRHRLQCICFQLKRFPDTSVVTPLTIMHNSSRMQNTKTHTLLYMCHAYTDIWATVLQFQCAWWIWWPSGLRRLKI